MVLLRTDALTDLTMPGLATVQDIDERHQYALHKRKGNCYVFMILYYCLLPETLNNKGKITIYCLLLRNSGSKQ